jgi:hypothetical protein
VDSPAVVGLAEKSLRADRGILMAAGDSLIAGNLDTLADTKIT